MSRKNHAKNINIGLLAHVDAGKTTLSEALLYATGQIRALGRVDHQDAFLDTDAQERARGITIFSKQARLRLQMTDENLHSEQTIGLTILDTPGHVDFSAEMERTLQVLDYAILVINGADGVQGHTMTLWRLLARYQIPTFLFINKMDQDGTDKEKLLAELKKRLSDNCVDFTWEKSDLQSQFLEDVSVCDEELLEKYLETEKISTSDIQKVIKERKLFPCFFGSALKMTGVEEFLHGLEKYCETPTYPSEFGAKVFKIARDDQGNRLSYMKITGGTLKVKELLTDTEKADQIRIYSGAKFELAKEAPAGTVCAVTGLSQTHPGQGFGIERESEMPVLEPVLNYRILLPEDCDVHQMLKKLKELEEEEPELHIVWNEQLGEIHAMLMGEVQIEILKHLIWERFHVAVEFGTGNIVYKETIAEPVEGVGHFEPLRHYAEVHLLLEPGEPGSGLQFFTACSEDVLDRNWQRLILTHLEEKRHVGVLTGSEITDLRILLIAGKAHTKHTEGGDFRQATYRAIRQGLRSGKSILLEPWFSYRLEVPTENLGRAMSDITRMNGRFDPPVTEGNNSVLMGSVPVATMRDYAREVASYTKGHGRLSCSCRRKCRREALCNSVSSGSASYGRRNEDDQ